MRGAQPWGWGSAGTAPAMASLLPPCLKFGVCLPSWPRAPPPCPDPLRAPVGVCGAAQPKGQAGRGETPQTHSSRVLHPHLGEMGRQAACESFQCCWKRFLCCHCGDKLTRCPALLCCTNAALAPSRTPPCLPRHCHRHRTTFDRAGAQQELQTWFRFHFFGLCSAAPRN